MYYQALGVTHSRSGVLILGNAYSRKEVPVYMERPSLGQSRNGHELKRMGINA